MKITKFLLLLLPLMAVAGGFGKQPPVPSTDPPVAQRVNPWGATEAGIQIGRSRDGSGHYGFGPAAELGLSWNRTWLPDFNGNPQPDFAWTDKTLAAEKDAGFSGHVLVLVISPSVREPSKWQPKTGVLKSALQQWLTAVALHYQGKVSCFQIENEPDGVGGDHADYATLFNFSMQVLKQADPTCKVMLASKSQIKNLDGSANTFWQSAFSTINPPDLLDLHWFGNATGEYAGAFKVIDRMRQLCQQRFGREIPIWICETGTYTGSPMGLPGQTEEQQADDLVRRFREYLAYGIDHIGGAWWIQENNAAGSWFTNHGIIRRDGTPKAAFGALKTYFATAEAH